LKDPNAEPVAIGRLMSIPLTSPIHLLMKIRGVRRRRHRRDNLSDLQMEAYEFKGNLKAENYLD